MTSGTRAGPGSVATVARATGLALTYAVTGFVGMVVAGLLAVPSADLQQGFVVRTVAVGALLVVVTVFTDRRRSLPVLLGISLAGYLLNPAAWAGRAFVAQFWLDPGPVTILVDGAAWVAVVAGTAWLKRAIAGER